MVDIEYFYSAHSAFAYLGSARFMMIAGAAGRRIVHRPIDLRRVVAEVGSVPFGKRGSVPVTKVDCTVVVTAGVTVRSDRTAPCFASAARFGAWASRADVMPTTLSTSVRFMLGV